MNLYTKTNEALIELYDNYIPQYDNLYTVSISTSSESGSTINVEGLDFENYIQFHATKVTFNGESLSLERDPVTKRFKLKSTESYTRTNNLEITWRECNGWKVKRYHDNWIGLFYDRKKDQYLSQEIPLAGEINNKVFRTITITFPYKENSIREGENTLNTKELNLKFYGVLPNTTGSISVGYSSTSNIVSHSLSYYVTDWEFLEPDILD